MLELKEKPVSTIEEPQEESAPISQGQHMADYIWGKVYQYVKALDAAKIALKLCKKHAVEVAEFVAVAPARMAEKEEEINKAIGAGKGTEKLERELDVLRTEAERKKDWLHKTIKVNPKYGHTMKERLLKEAEQDVFEKTSDLSIAQDAAFKGKTVVGVLNKEKCSLRAREFALEKTIAEILGILKEKGLPVIQGAKFLNCSQFVSTIYHSHPLMKMYRLMIDASVLEIRKGKYMLGDRKLAEIIAHPNLKDVPKPDRIETVYVNLEQLKELQPGHLELKRDGDAKRMIAIRIPAKIRDEAIDSDFVKPEPRTWQDIKDDMAAGRATPTMPKANILHTMPKSPDRLIISEKLTVDKCRQIIQDEMKLRIEEFRIDVIKDLSKVHADQQERLTQANIQRIRLLIESETKPKLIDVKVDEKVVAELIREEYRKMYLRVYEEFSTSEPEETNE
ncbi:hypothetical protein LCGC14_0691510 [marine sediment metagenome]|uniref:Uncharacterized protein n=1 Tax=marine sediment metagenome TaxID=412755 RepID=A0A0F9TTA6_9ZZZZ